MLVTCDVVDNKVITSFKNCEFMYGKCCKKGSVYVHWRERKTWHKTDNWLHSYIFIHTCLVFCSSSVMIVNLTSSGFMTVCQIKQDIWIHQARLRKNMMGIFHCCLTFYRSNSQRKYHLQNGKKEKNQSVWLCKISQHIKMSFFSCVPFQTCPMWLVRTAVVELVQTNVLRQRCGLKQN